MKKKKWLIPAIMIAVLVFVLFTPVQQCVYEDGGTREYTALTYKIVKWNRFVSVYNEEGTAMERIDIYHNTSVYWFPDNFKSIDELWEMEYQAD